MGFPTQTRLRIIRGDKKEEKIIGTLEIYATQIRSFIIVL